VKTCIIFNAVHHLGFFHNTAYRKLDASVKYKGSWSDGLFRKRLAKFLAAESNFNQSMYTVNIRYHQWDIKVS
jgi:hypothetical protein